MEKQNNNKNNNEDTVQAEFIDIEENQEQEKQTSKQYPETLAILPSGSKPVFPGLMFPMILAPGTEAHLLREIYNNTEDRLLGFLMPKNDEISDKKINKNFVKMGTAAKIIRLQESEEGAVQALLQGKQRFIVEELTFKKNRLHAKVTYPQDIFPAEEDQEIKAICLSILGTMRNLMRHNPLFSEEIKLFLTRADWEDPSRLADFCVTMTSSTSQELQEVLNCLNIETRLEKALLLLRKELDINELKEKITSQIDEKISNQQREFFLKEQLKAIKQELGLEKDDKTEEIEKFLKRLEGIELNEETQTRLDEEINKMKLLSPHSPEFAVVRNYLDWLTDLPWGKYSTDKINITASRRILNKDHHGLEDVKKRILEFIAVAKLKKSVDGSILCLIGPPGVGKTSLGKSIAKALDRKFFRFSLGGMRDEAEIKGHRRTYIGAMPGKFMQAMRNVKTSNPVIMLDEIDKVGVSYQGDPASALLEVLDPEQNSSFRDHYLDVPFDLSKVLFIATANVSDTIPAPLLDRMETIRLSGYIMQEKLTIAKKHLIPKLLPKNGLTNQLITFTTPALKLLILGHAREAGVRSLEKAISNCMRKVATIHAESKLQETYTVTDKKVEELLGKPTFTDDPLMKQRRPGVVMGLAWTAYGGSTLYIEAIKIAGKPTLTLTGQLGDVMKESSHIAYSMVKSIANSINIPKKTFSEHTIHLHVPAGATPKDGPSAGITMATALISMALNKPIPVHVAMTGELTLTGRVLPVGGIKEKVIAAKRAKTKQIIMPKINEKDFQEIPEKIKKGITPYFVEQYQEVYQLIFNHGLKNR